jgi:uroporphyrinogen-III synthase
VRPGIPPLAGYRVAVTADRRAEEQIALLERRGASIVLAPTVRTLPIVDGDQLGAAIEAVIEHPPDVVVLLTGIGTRGMLAAAEGMGRDDGFVDALRDAVVIARGPKAMGAGTTAGLEVTWRAPSERSSEILERLTPDAEAGARIAVQRDGERTPYLADALAALGADVVDIPVYRWELPDDTRAAIRLVEQLIDRDVDAVTFTSSPAVRHLVEIAADAGRRTEVIDALQADVVAVCVGPVCAETAVGLGIPAAVVPNRARLGAMVQSMAVHFGGQVRTIATATGELSLQGRSVFVGGEPVPVGGRERAVLEVLADAAGAVVSKQKLLRAVWGEDFDDEHAVEVAVGRLRRALGTVGPAVETVPRRGYRLSRRPPSSGVA